jgi:CBS domain-containing protein
VNTVSKQIVRDAMSAVLVTVGPSHTLREAATLMADREVGSAVVFDPDGMGPAIVTERDIVRAVSRGIDMDTALVSEHLTRDNAIGIADWPLEEASRAMMRSHRRHLLVVDEGEVVGVVSIRDIVAAWEPLLQRMTA